MLSNIPFDVQEFSWPPIVHRRFDAVELQIERHSVITYRSKRVPKGLPRTHPVSVFLVLSVIPFLLKQSVTGGGEGTMP